jgi:hypothetical protein
MRHLNSLIRSRRRWPGSRQHRLRGVRLTLLSLVLGLQLAVPAHQAVAFHPSCTYCTAEAPVLPGTDPLLNASMKWCGLSEAPTVADPSLYCEDDFKSMLWRRHERASDCVWIPQSRLTLRSGGAIQHTGYTQFGDVNLGTGAPGDVVVDSPFTELLATFEECDMDWATQPKGIIAVSVNRLIDGAGNFVARGIAIEGSVTMPWMAVSDQEALSQLNERSLAHEAGHVLSLGHTTVPGNLMQTGGAGATLDSGQIATARTYLSANTILDPPGGPVAQPDLVDYLFDAGGDGQPGEAYLDLKKVVAIDNSASGGDFSLFLATAAVLPEAGAFAPTGGPITPFPVDYSIALDTDNDPTTGGNPMSIVPGLNLAGVELVAAIRVELDPGPGGFLATPRLWAFDPKEGFIDLTEELAESLEASARNLDLVLCDPAPGFVGPERHPIAAEMSFKLAGEAFPGLGLPAGGVLFPSGLRLQTQARSATSAVQDLGPDAPGVLDFPPIQFPRVEAPQLAQRGRLLTLSVAGMPPNRPLMVFLGELEIDPQAFSDGAGNAVLSFLVPVAARLGPTLLTVGIPDPTNAMTADTVVEVVQGSIVEVPTLGPLGMLVLLTLLAVAGFVALRRRGGAIGS